MGVIYRTEHTTAELHAFVELEIAIWGLSERDAVPANLLRTVTKNGGVLVGAYAESGVPIGLSFGFPARRNGKWLLWSHMTGVHPAYQRQGIGLELKRRQKQWALKNGFTQMRWTFDPLQAGNAHFNLALLGAQADKYYVDYYGEMGDVINARLPSDRVEAVWNLRAAASVKHSAAPGSLPDDESLALQVDVSGYPTVTSDAANTLCRPYVEIPPHLDLAHDDRAVAWRLALRAVLQPALERGLVLSSFQRCGERCWYVLSTPSPWFMYVLECADGSFYTGVAKNPASRIAQHSTGRGAAYTTSRRPLRFAGMWRFLTQSDALRAEAAFKRQSHAQKRHSLESGQPFKGGSFERNLHQR